MLAASGTFHCYLSASATGISVAVFHTQLFPTTSRHLKSKVSYGQPGSLTAVVSSSGLFQRRIWFFYSYSEVKLETATVNVTIQDNVADVVSELFFRNVEPVSLETMFIFPVDSSTVVHSFYATMGDTRIEAMLCEKEEVLRLQWEGVVRGLG